MNWIGIELKDFRIRFELELNWIEKSWIQLELELNWIERNELIWALLGNKGQCRVSSQGRVHNGALVVSMNGNIKSLNKKSQEKNQYWFI